MTVRRAGRARWERAARIGADVALPELHGIAPEPATERPATDEITVKDAATRLGVLPSTVRGYLRATKRRPARLTRRGDGVSAASVEEYAASRKPAPTRRKGNR